MDNNLSSPNPSQSPFSGGIVKWIVGIIVIIVVYRFGMMYLSNPAVLNNIGQQIQQTVDNVSNNLNTATDTHMTVATSAPVNSELDNAIEKVSELTSCVNYADQTIRTTIEHYDRFVNFENPAKTSFNGLITESSWQTCDGDINDALGITTDTPELDTVVREFQKQGNATVAAFKEITPYYKQKDFLDDDFALGKAKDAALLQQSIAYVKASDAFRAAVDKQEDTNSSAQIAALSQDPSAQNQVLALQLFMDAKKVVNALSETTLNAADLEKKINDLVASQSKFSDVVLTSLKAENASKYNSWNSVSTSMDDYIASAKSVWRLVRDSKPVPENNEGSIKQAIDKFNRVVQNYNMSNNMPMYRL